MKECPSCSADVPESATRCKECFHDFTEQPRARSGGPIFLLGALAAMAIVGSLTLWFVISRPVEEHILVDDSTQSIVWTRQYRGRVETDRLMWDDVAKLEYVLKASGAFEIVAVTSTGERKIIQEDVHPLKTEASHYAQVMEKPLAEVDNTRGFHKMGDE